MSTAKAPAAPSGRICEKQLNLFKYRISLYIAFTLYIVESSTPLKIFHQPLSHLTFWVGPCTHPYQNQLKSASFNFFHRFILYSCYY